jgi:PAS domain S-box-containing protein
VISKRRLYLLLAAVAIELALGLAVRLEQLRRLAAGEHDAAAIVAAVGLCWLVVVGAIAVALGRSLYDARRELHRQRQAIAADASTSEGWLWEADAGHRFTYSSAGVVDLLGYQPEEMLGRSALSLLRPDQAPTAERLFEQSLRGRTGWTDVDFVWSHKDGSPVVLHGTAAPILDERGRVIGYRGIRRKVTEAMAAERTLAAARRRLRDLLADPAVTIALQPIVDLGTGRLAGVEALARFADGRGPDEWFGDARATGMSCELDRLTFGAALDLLPNLPPRCYLSVNASPELLIQSSIVDELLATTVPLDRLVIEVTEHVKISSYPDLLAALAKLRQRGVRLAIDDTGAGYASFNHVLQLRPDVIKIDRSLIADITGDPARRSLVTALVLLALDLGATVTGEGVETPSELETLATLGVDCGQGYLLGRPSDDGQQWTGWFTRNWLEPSIHLTDAVRGSRGAGTRQSSRV